MFNIILYKDKYNNLIGAEQLAPEDTIPVVGNYIRLYNKIFKVTWVTEDKGSKSLTFIVDEVKLHV